MAATMGKDGWISFDGTTSRPTFFDSWTLNPAIDLSEVTAFGDASKVYASTLRSWTITATATMDRSDSNQLTLMNDFESTASSTTLPVRIYPTTSYWSGNAFVTSQSVNSQVGDKITVNWTLQGSGDLSYITT